MFNNKKVFKGVSVGLATALMTSTITSVIPHVAYAKQEDAVRSEVYLSDIEWKVAKTDWSKVQKDKSIDKAQIKLDGKKYAKGIGTHSNSEIIYNLKGNYSRFTSDIGVDDEVGVYGSVVFKVFGDGKELYKSPLMTGNSKTQIVDVDITAVDELKLIVEYGADNINNDHADWADAKLISGGGTEVGLDTDENKETNTGVKEDGELEKIEFKTQKVNEKGQCSLSGKVTGLTSGDEAIVTIQNDVYLKSIKASGAYSFSELPIGKYMVKVEAAGYSADKEKEITVSSRSENINFDLKKLDNSKFAYHWEADKSLTGYEVSSHVNKPLEIEFLNEKLEVIDNSASEKLSHYYNIILNNEEEQWSQEYGYRLFEIMDTIPQLKRNSGNEQNLKPSKWILTDKHVKNDIEIIYTDKGHVVSISKDVFVNATPKLAKVDEAYGNYFSQKLHHALVRYVTKNGTDLNAVEKILNERYGCTTRISDYKALTSVTTNEDKGRFQQFKPEELMELINVFEEMPEGYHSVKGLKYIARRKDGTPHPLYPNAPAVAWPIKDKDSYIEFMESAFLGDSSYINKLIAHEKTHFMWENLFSDALKSEWIKVGGWYKNSKDENGWSTTKTTEFASYYAHGINPNEDMAESVSYFMFNPDKLRSVSPAKYDFIKNYIMHGNTYISTIRKDLTFEVYNLDPDYKYPGKINRVDITAVGKANEDKTVTVEIGLDTMKDSFKGAQNANLRIFSEIGTYKDLYLYPVSGTNGSVLRGSVTIDKTAKDGLWTVDQITTTDQVGNQRFEGIDDFGWKLYINNSAVDTTAPQYVKNSLEYKLTDETIEGKTVKKLNVNWDFRENVGMKENNSVYVSLVNSSTMQDSIGGYGTIDPKTVRASVDFYLTEYMQSGDYYVSYLSMSDKADNRGDQRFSNSSKDEKPKYINITSSNPDWQKPELDLNKITVKAEPVNAKSPDGETKVEITYYAKDDKAGLGSVYYILLDPQGKTHANYHYHENFHTQFFKGNASEWKKYTITTVLPKGSAPGSWGLQQFNFKDKAGNKNDVNFQEIIHFNVLKK